MDDLISRQTEIEMLCAMRCGCKPKDCGLTLEQDGAEECADVRWIKSLSSAQKTGHWIMKEKVYDGLIEDSVYRYECSECGFSDEHNSSREVPFCWHCGARMKGE